MQLRRRGFQFSQLPSPLQEHTFGFMDCLTQYNFRNTCKQFRIFRLRPDQTRQPALWLLLQALQAFVALAEAQTPHKYSVGDIHWIDAASGKAVGKASFVGQMWQYLKPDDNKSGAWKRDRKQLNRKQTASLDSLSVWLGRAARFNVNYSISLHDHQCVSDAIINLVNAAANQLGYSTCIIAYPWDLKDDEICTVQAGFCKAQNKKMITVHAVRKSGFCTLQESDLHLEWTKLVNLKLWHILIQQQDRRDIKDFRHWRVMHSKAEVEKDFGRSEVLSGWLWQHHTVDSTFEFDKTV